MQKKQEQPPQPQSPKPGDPQYLDALMELLRSEEESLKHLQ